MKKYFQIIKNTWEEYMTYRLNFVLWRVRVVLGILVTYFLWWAIFSGRGEFFGYSQSMILTYIILSNIVRTIVLGTTTMEIGEIINQGDLSNFLIRPLSFLRYYIARDTGDKLLNLAFCIVEVPLMILMLKPQIFFQTNITFLLLALLAMFIGMILYFFFSLTLGYIGFWSPDVWAPRFISFVVTEFFAGGLFPIDILPTPLYLASISLPFSYFIYFPLKVYLGQLSPLQILSGFSVGIFWMFGFSLIASILWRRGLRVYTAQGR